jgi:hypothetical protein
MKPVVLLKGIQYVNKNILFHRKQTQMAFKDGNILYGCFFFMIVTESTSETNYTWVVTDTSQLHVKWPGRFINERHDVNGWLEPVANHTSIETVYDDIFGRRTVQWYTNCSEILLIYFLD